MTKSTETRPTTSDDETQFSGTFELYSPAFEAGDPIPDAYTCEGDDVSPALSWSRVPEATESLALIVDDPDAPGRTFTHWLLFNIPADRTELPRALDVDTHFSGANPAPKEGKNDFGNVGYGGPCPPEGNATHRYFFRLYALDTALDLKRGVNKKALQSAMEGHVLADAKCMGTFRR